MSLLALTSKSFGLLSLRSVVDSTASQATAAFFSSGAGGKVDVTMPPRPGGPYFMYLNNRFKPFRQEYPSLTMNEATRKIGEEWRTLPAEKKAVYQDQFLSKKAEYEKQVAALNARAKTDPAVKQALDDLKQEKRERRASLAVNRIKKEMKEAGIASLQAPNAYAMFFADQYYKLSSSGSSFEDTGRTLGVKWKAMDAAARKVYEDRAAAEKAQLKAKVKENQELVDKYKKAKKVEQIAKAGPPPPPAPKLAAAAKKTAKAASSKKKVAASPKKAAASPKKVAKK